MGERVKEADVAVTKVQSEIQVQLEQTNNKLAIQVHFPIMEKFYHSFGYWNLTIIILFFFLRDELYINYLKNLADVMCYFHIKNLCTFSFPIKINNIRNFLYESRISLKYLFIAQV